MKARYSRCQQSRDGRTLRLFHGTLEQSANSIAQLGFKMPEQFQRADCLQETGQLTFGKAVYFSERADLACDFGEATLVIADVALGREWRATQSLPHLDAERMRTQGKDSVVFGRTHEYAVYEESQAVPLYVVTYLLVASASLTEAYDRASLEAMYERVTDARSVDWGLVLKHVGAEGRPRQRHVALRKLGDICRDDQAATCALLPAALLRALKEQCLTLEAAEEDAPVTWLALRLCWNVAYKNPPMQRSLVDKVGAGTFTALLAHWNNDVVDRALGAIVNLAFAEDVKAKFMRSPRLRTFLMTVAEPLMDSWSEEVREEATRLFSCLIAEGHAPKEWLEQ